MELEADLVLRHGPARQPGPLQSDLALLDVLLGGAALIVEGEHLLEPDGVEVSGRLQGHIERRDGEGGIGAEQAQDVLVSIPAAIKAERRHFAFRYWSPEHFLDVFKVYYGPTFKAFAALDDAKRQCLTSDLIGLIASLNRADDGTMVVPSEYLEIVITKR
jgi:hypothetical protein